jgi:hypothetical protein
MRIPKPPRLSRAFGRSRPGAPCEPFSVTATFAGDRCTVVAVAGDIDLAIVAIVVECGETAKKTGGLSWSTVRSPQVWRLLRRTGVAGFSCYRDRVHALAALG